MDTQNGTTMSLEEQYQSALNRVKDLCWTLLLLDDRSMEEIEQEYPEVKEYNEARKELKQLEQLLGK